MAIPTGNEAYLLKCVGDACSFTSGSVTTNFYGILDKASSIQYDKDGAPVYVLGTHLTVEQRISDMLSKDMVVTVSNTNYQVRDIAVNNDPYFSLVELAEVTP